MKWPHYQKYVNQIIVNIKISLKLNFINIQSLHSNSPGCTSFLESNFLEILVLCETFSTRSSNFSLQGYLPLIWKDSMTHIHRLTAFWRSKFKKGLIFRKLWGFLFMFSTDFTSSHLFPLFIIVFVLDAISSNIYRLAQSTNLLTNLSLETLTSIISTG